MSLAIVQVLETNTASLENLKKQRFEVFNQYSVYENALPLPEINNSSKPKSVREISSADRALFKEIENKITPRFVLDVKGSAETQFFLSGWQRIYARFTRYSKWIKAEAALVDVSKLESEAGFRYPSAITANLYVRFTPNQSEKELGQSNEGRLWDAVFLASFVARQVGVANQSQFEFCLFEAEEDPPHCTQRSTSKLWIVVNPGDEGEPVITIGFHEDF